MKSRFFLALSLLGFATASLSAAQPRLTGEYLEVRSCDIYTGSCIANSQMGLAGKEGILVWHVDKGDWNGVSLDGLSVVAVLRTDATLGDVKYHPRNGRAVLIVDEKASAPQRAALVALAKANAGTLVAEIVDVKVADVQVAMKKACSSGSCATVKAGNLLEVSTRCLGGKDHLCGNEETYYPPLTRITEAVPAFTELAAYHGNGLGMTWESTGERSAFLGSFSH